MTGKKEVVFAVELVEHDKRMILFDYTRHSTPEEAKDFAAEHTGIPWKELERRGAKVVQQELTVHPGDPLTELPEEWQSTS